MIIKISVIIPTFNRRSFIKDAIDSVLSQSYVVDEIIVVDNNSTDGTNTLIKKKYPEIKLIQEKKQGVSNARNAGILIAQNDWIAFLDSDDQWLPKKIELQIENIRNNFNKPLFVHTNELWIRNGHILNQKKKHQKLQGDCFKESLHMCLISPSSVLIKKCLFKKFGMFKPWLKVCEDYEFWIRLTSKLPISLVKEPCTVKYGGHADQLSRSFWGMDRFRVRALEKLMHSHDFTTEQKEEILKVLIKKIGIIISGAEKRKNNKIFRIYKFKKSYWEKFIING